MVALTNQDLLIAAKKHNIPLIDVVSKNELGPNTRLIPGGYIINLQDTHDAQGNQRFNIHFDFLTIPH